MKRFVFTLQKLLDYRRLILDTEKNTLGVMRRELSDLNEKLGALIALTEQLRADLSERLTRGTSPAELASIKRYITIKQQEQHKVRRDIAQKQKEIDRQLETVVEATREVSKLEKLEEAQKEEYKQLEQKENEQFIEEFVSNADWRKAHGDE